VSNSDTTIGLRVLQFPSKCLRIDIHVNGQLLIQRVRAVQMDIGVGSFVVANALVSRQARNLPPSKYGGVLRNVSPLLILGLARLIVTKGVDYQEHVAEYGVHWNFFFTLAGVALLTSLIHVPPTYCGSLGIAILSVYQVMLSGGLNRYLLSSERGPGFLSLNKEGVASTFGYWGLYLISIQLGHYLNFKHASILEWFWQMSNTQKGGTGTMSQWWAAADIGLLDLALWYLITCSLMLLSSVRFFPGKHCDLMIQRLHTSLICQCFLDGKSALF
jgi:phosphatidylinositol glycan class W